MTRPGPAAAAAALLVVLSATATPARADSAAPTTFRSEVIRLEPAVEGVVVEVVGGDAFLAVEVAPGREMEIPGYEGEPYIRIGSDGVVEVNRNSPSHWLNEDRYGRTSVPEGASVEAPPRWERVSGNGSYGWHDHRIHWMSPDPPPGVDRSRRDVLYEWSVPLVVEGRQVTVRGILEWVPPISPVPWIVLAGAAGAAMVVRPGWRRWLLAAGGGLSSLVGITQAAVSPLGLAGEIPVWGPPMAATALALVPAGEGISRRISFGLAAVLLTVWAALRITSLWMPVLPSPLPAGLERAVVALAAGTGTAALATLYRPARQAPTP